MKLFGKRRVYLDYASATPVLKEALRAMAHAEQAYANPGGIHADATAAKKILEDSREGMARELGCKPRQLIFTSGLTESNNLAVLGFARKLALGSLPAATNTAQAGTSLEDTHWITSAIEHDSVLECFGEIERLGGKVTFAEPNERGVVTSEAVERLLKPETVFVSVGWANNEIGTVQPLRAISQKLKEREKTGQRILLHSDAGQGPLYLSPQVHTLGVDLFSLGAGKLYGPRSVGALFVRDSSALAPIMLGGSQEGGLRAGTEEPVPALGFARAFETISGERKQESERLEKLRSQFAHELSKHIPDLVVNGLPAPRAGAMRQAGDLKHALPHMLNVSIPNISSEYIALALDRAGISISTRSACRSDEQSSHVVAALGGDEWRAKNTLRISLGRQTHSHDRARVVDVLKEAVSRYRTSRLNA